MTEIPGDAHQSQASHPKVTWETLDYLDWQLWMLAVLLIGVLGVGVLSFMFPTAFLLKESSAIRAPERVFFGFCVLLALTLVYLLQKQAKLRQLKRELVEAQTALARAEQEADIQALQTLPSLDQFRDTLAMEYRRASTAGTHVAVVLFNAPSVPLEGLGRMTSLVRSMLRHGETLYRISDKAVGLILPGMKLSNGMSFAAHVEALSGFPKRDLEVKITAYPDDVSTLTELEGKLRKGSKIF